MQIEYIKSGGEKYYHQEKGEQDPTKIEGICYPICLITKKVFGRYQVDYYDEFEKPVTDDWYQENQIPNRRLVIYPSGVEEIKYKVQ